MKIDENQKIRNKSTNIKRNSLRHTVGLGTAVRLIRKRDSNFDSTILFEILSNGGITAFIITEYGRIPIPPTYWAGLTKDDVPRWNLLNLLTVEYQKLLPLVTMQVVAARRSSREFESLDGGVTFEAHYPDLAMWLRANSRKGLALKSEEMRDELDGLLAALAHPITKKYRPRVTRSEINSYIGGCDGLPKKKTGKKLSAMPDAFWFQLIKYFSPFQKVKDVKKIAGEMAIWVDIKFENDSLHNSKYVESRIDEIVHTINGIGAGKTNNS